MKKITIISIVLVAIVTLTTLTQRRQKQDKSNVIVLTDKNFVVLKDDVNSRNVSRVLQKMIELDNKEDVDQPIYLVLDTPGGSIIDGARLIDTAKALKRPVHTISLVALSMGWQIAQGLGERYVLPTSVLMSHKAFGGFDGEFGGQKGSQLEKRLEFWNQMIKKFDEQTVRRTKGKQTLESYQSSYENELWLLGHEAVELGYADKVALVRCDSTLNGYREDVLSFFGLQFLVKFSNCPLISSPLEVSIIKNENTKFISNEIEDKMKKEVMFYYSLEGKKQRAKSVM